MPEDALFSMEIEPGDAHTRKRSSSSEVATTATGQNASDIIGQWVGLCQGKTDGVPVPSTIIKRMAKQVRLLITAGYTTNQIKMGLTVWTVRWFENPMLSPTTLEQLTWRVSIDTSKAGRAFQAEMQHAKEVLVGATSAASDRTSPTERRNSENIKGEMGWRERVAERQRREKEMGLNG